jgi:hypothetical protein
VTKQNKITIKRQKEKGLKNTICPFIGHHCEAHRLDELPAEPVAWANNSLISALWFQNTAA